MKKLFGGSSGGLWKPKNTHSLEYLKYLHTVLQKNTVVTEQNRSLIVEALRSISEILIWGDQNDSTVFDFFLEKQMLTFFLGIMKQKAGSYVNVQLLQTLNIMFENIRHETSLYFLLSNNHVNEIITHRFDFENEEIMAYYISFLKTLSFKLNSYTIHFFFNDQTNEFPLYTEALRFFNHSECMVRTAVRTLTLNVYMLNNPGVNAFVSGKSAVPYLSNLAWYVRNHVLELDSHLSADYSDGSSHPLDKVRDLIAEHVDHMHYVNDILILDIEPLSQLLIDQLMRKLLVPLYLGSLVPELQAATLHVSRVVALFLLAQVFNIITHTALMQQLLSLLLFGDQQDMQVAHECVCELNPTVLERVASPSAAEAIADEVCSSSSQGSPVRRITRDVSNLSPLFSCLLTTLRCDKSDHEAVYTLCLLYSIGRNTGVPSSLLEAAQLPCQSGAHETLPVPETYDKHLIGRLVDILLVCTDKDSACRVLTVDLCLLLLRHMILSSGDVSQTPTTSNGLQPVPVESHSLEPASDVQSESNSVNNGDATTTAASGATTTSKEGSHSNSLGRNAWAYLHSPSFVRCISQCLRTLAKQLAPFFSHYADNFLDWFELEYDLLQRREIRLQLLLTDAQLLLAPDVNPTVDRVKRLAKTSEDRCRRLLRLFFLLRQFVLDLEGQQDDQLPLTSPDGCVKVNDCLDLSKSDMLACTVVVKSSKTQRFLVTDGLQLILVEPDANKLGHGVAQFVAFLQDVVLNGDKDDSKVLHVTVHSKASKQYNSTALPLLAAKFVFDDHIRCMAAKQRLTKGAQAARQYKTDLIADLLHVPRLNAATHRPLSQQPRRPGSAASSSSGAFDSLNSSAYRGRVPGYASRTQTAPAPIKKSSQSPRHSQSPSSLTESGSKPQSPASQRDKASSPMTAIQLKEMTTGGNSASTGALPDQTGSTGTFELHDGRKSRKSSNHFVPPNLMAGSNKIHDV